MNNRQIMRAAHHETGHAIAALLLDMGLERVSIEGYPRKNAVTVFDPGYTGNENPDDPATRDKVLKNAVVSAAGIAADTEYCRMRRIPYDDGGTEDDQKNVVGMVGFLHRKSENVVACNDDIAACTARARALVRDNWPLIHRVAKELYNRETLTADEIRGLTTLAAD
jgi:ATP-dependent Zn protease